MVSFRRHINQRQGGGGGGNNNAITNKGEVRRRIGITNHLRGTFFDGPENHDNGD